jgi:hypothetical protein
MTTAALRAADTAGQTSPSPTRTRKEVAMIDILVACVGLVGAIVSASWAMTTALRVARTIWALTAGGRDFGARIEAANGVASTCSLEFAADQG